MIRLRPKMPIFDRREIDLVANSKDPSLHDK